MEIGIITFHNVHDYGSVLQAWAFQKYLEQQGHEVELINFQLKSISKLQRLTYRTYKKFTGIKRIDRWINNLYYQVRTLLIHFREPERYKKYTQFENFINSKLSLTDKYTVYGKLKKAKLEYDVLITGGNEIWNVNIMRGVNLAYFLQFANKNAIRVSYAASTGSNSIPNKYQLLFQRYLRDFDAISVREKQVKEELEEITDQTVTEVLDPTLLLKKEDYNKLKKNSDVRGKYIYVHSVQSDKPSKALKKVAGKVSKKSGSPIVHNLPKKIFKNESKHFNGTVGEYLGIVSKAEYVVTDSFYCMIFAIIYEKDFIAVSNAKSMYSMKNLLEKLELSDHLVADVSSVPSKLSKLKIDYTKVGQKIAEMREKSQDFLGNAFQGKKPQNRRNYLEYPDIFRCYSCNACKESCPVSAISMQEDKEGFSYPVVNQDKCIHCDTCKKACVYHRKDLQNKTNKKFPVVYAAYHKDAEVVKTSRTGGVFTAFYHSILQKNGVVIGVTFDKNMHVVYDIADNEADCKRFRGYKYVFPEIRDIMVQVKAALEDGEYVLFSGMPCQIVGLKSYLGKNYDKLYTVEMVCRGMSSPKVFDKYIEYLEQIYQSPVVGFQFQNKFNGLNNPYVIAEFASESIDIEKTSTNNFAANYQRRTIDRPSCYTCEFTGLKNGVADITIGNYRGIQKTHPGFGEPGGVSILKINTDRGQEIFQDAREELNLCESTYAEAFSGYSSSPITMTSLRPRMMYYIDEKPINSLLQTFNLNKKGGIHEL